MASARTADRGAVKIGKGTLYVAFVKLTPDGSTKVPVSNTVTAKVE